MKTYVLMAGAVAGALAGVAVMWRTGSARDGARVEPSVVAGSDAAAEGRPATSLARGEAATAPQAVTDPRPALAAPVPGRGAEVKGDLGSSDVSSPDYDPVAVIETTRAFPMDIVRRESRVEAFAARREAFLRPIIERRVRALAPGAFALEVRCLTSSCEVTVVPQGVTLEHINAIEFALQAPPRIADGVQPRLDGQLPAPRMWFGLVFSKEHRAHDSFERWVADHERAAAK